MRVDTHVHLQPYGRSSDFTLDDYAPVDVCDKRAPSSYNLPVLGNANLGYVLSAGLGILVIAIVVWLFSWLVTARPGSQKREK